MSPERLDDVLASYDSTATLESASTIPASWYTDSALYELERRAVFGDWQMVGRLDQVAAPGQFFTADVAGEPLILPRRLAGLHVVERRKYSFDSNWKVFVDNYLDGGYHIPYLHKGLDSVLPYSEYTIENGDRFCLQSSPVRASGRDAATEAVRKGDR